MLISLRVRGLATVADATLEFSPGLNVLTGETGAGKSMLVDALALVLGDRADRAAVRPGSDRAIVDAEFSDTIFLNEQLAELGLDAADGLIIRREVQQEGRSRAWLNGSPVAIAVLREIGGMIADMHGQHQTVELGEPARQLALIDAIGGCELPLGDVAAAHARLRELEERLVALRSDRAAALSRESELRALVGEIDAAKLKAGEDEELGRQIGLLSHAVARREHAARISGILDDERHGVEAGLAEVRRAIEALGRIDPAAEGWMVMLEQAWTNLGELRREADDYRDGIADDPMLLDRMQRRRDEIARLVRRYGGSVESALLARVEADGELQLVDSAAFDERKLEGEVEAARRRLDEAATVLTAARTAAIGVMESGVNGVLPALGLGAATFRVGLIPRDRIGVSGAEGVEFRAALNRGMPERPIASSASGGELARLMLAIKVTAAGKDATPTLVFDEVDQGVGGEVAVQLADALARLGERHQVLIVTHSPQIAARGGNHLLVAKGETGGIATSAVSRLDGEERVVEIARMLGDPSGEDARRLARGMVRLAAN